MISFKQINYALAVEKTRHFKKAAELCSVSQAALSSAILELERKLDIQIFERDNKKVLITHIGEQFLLKARKIKIDVDELNQYCNSQKSLLSFPLSLGVIPTIGPYLLPRVLPEVRKQFPDLQIILEEGQSHVLIDKVKKGELDTAIIALPFHTDGLHTFEFWQEDFYVVTHITNDAVQGYEISSDKLEKSQLLLLEDGHCLKDHALSVCKFKQTDLGASFSGTSLYTLLQMVSSKMGVTIVPHMGIKQLLHSNTELKVAHLNEPGPHRRIAFITRLNYAGVSNIELLIKLFRQRLKI